MFLGMVLLLSRVRDGLLLAASFIDPQRTRQEGGIEPLHVSMPHELKSCPSTSPTHPGLCSGSVNLVLYHACMYGIPILMQLEYHSLPNSSTYMYDSVMFGGHALLGGVSQYQQRTTWPVGLMDKASASGAGDSRFESWAGQSLNGAKNRGLKYCNRVQR